MTESSKPGRLEVDGEVFHVTADPDQPGAHHYTWETGPNPGYGFSEFRSDHGENTTAEHQEAIRDFLAQIDPETGYID